MYYKRLRTRKMVFPPGSHPTARSPLTGSAVMLEFPPELERGKRVTENEINRAVQYVTASTSYGRETVAEIIRTGLAELTALATTSSRHFEREALLEYVCYWTIKRTAHPEPLVRRGWDMRAAGWTRCTKRSSARTRNCLSSQTIRARPPANVPTSATHESPAEPAAVCEHSSPSC